MKIDIKPMEDNGSPPINVSELKTQGWEMQDFPQMKEAYWEYLLKAFGEEGKDYHKLSEATYDHTNFKLKRGILLLAPGARNNLKEYRAVNPIPEDTVH